MKDTDPIRVVQRTAFRSRRIVLLESLYDPVTSTEERVRILFNLKNVEEHLAYLEMKYSSEVYGSNGGKVLVHVNEET